MTNLRSTILAAIVTPLFLLSACSTTGESVVVENDREYVIGSNIPRRDKSVVTEEQREKAKREAQDIRDKGNRGATSNIPGG